MSIAEFEIDKFRIYIKGLARSLPSRLIWELACNDVRCLSCQIHRMWIGKVSNSVVEPTTAWTDMSRSGPCNPYQDVRHKRVSIYETSERIVEEDIAKYERLKTNYEDPT